MNENQLVVIEKTEIANVFKKEGLNPLIDKIEKEVESFVPDLSTDKSRKEIASMAYKVAQSKTYLDGLGKDLVAKIKTQTKEIDSERKRMRDKLDELKDKVRKPLTEYENEIKLEEAAKLEEFKRQKDWQEAIDYNLLRNREIEIKRKEKEIAEKEAEQNRIEEEKRAKKELEDAARVKAEKEAQAEIKKAEEAAIRVKLENERLEREKQEAIDKAGRDKKEAEIKAKIEAERVEKDRLVAIEKAENEKKEATKKAELEKSQAIEAERKRVDDERIKKENEDRKRSDDIEHRGKINREAKNDLMNNGFENLIAESIVKLVVSGKIRNISIRY